MHVDKTILFLQGSQIGQETYSIHAAVFTNILLCDFTEVNMQARKADEECERLRYNFIEFWFGNL